MREMRGDAEGAEAGVRAGAMRSATAAAAANLGVALHERGEVDAAQAAFARADERGHGGGAFNLGLMLEARGDRAGRRAALPAGADRGRPARTRRRPPATQIA